MGLAQRLVHNSVHNAVGRVWVMFLTLLLTAYTIARLGDELFALWAVMLAIINYASVIDMGTGNAFSKFVAEYRARDDRDGLSAVVTGGFFFYVAGSVVVFTAGWFLESWLAETLRIPVGLREDFRFVFRVTLLCFVGQHVANALRSVVFGVQRIDVMRSIWVGTSLVQGAGAVLAIEAGLGIRGLALSHLLFVAVTGVVTLRAATGLCPGLRLDVRTLRWALVRRMIGFGMRLQGTSIANTVHMHIDKFFLAAQVGLQWTAFYELGRRAARAVGTLPLLLPDVVMPAVSEIETHGDRERIRHLYREGLRIVVLITLPLVGGVLATAPWIVMVWVGPGYGWAAVSMMVVAVTFGFQVLTGMGTAVLRGVGRPGIEMWNRIVMVAAHVACVAVLVRTWGLVGVLVGYGATSLVGDAALLVAIHRFVDYPLWRAMREIVVRPAIGTAVAGAAAGLTGIGLSGALGIGGRGEALAVLAVQALVYGGVLLALLVAMRVVGRREWELARRMISALRATPVAGAPEQADAPARRAA